MTLEAKFETGAPEPPFDAGTIPWAYGDDRITALVRSPDSLYVYWEITDDAIARARKRLGPAGDHGWFNLRLYDTTAREFDGINAHSYFDVTVDRETRDYFFDLRQPTASFHVEVGIKSHEGYFQPIARSGRADFPRKEPSQDRSLEWLSVTSEPHPSAKPYRSKFNPPPAPPPGASPAPTQPRSEPSGGTATLHQHSEERTFTWAHPAHVELRWEGPWLSTGRRGSMGPSRSTCWTLRGSRFDCSVTVRPSSRSIRAVSRCSGRGRSRSRGSGPRSEGRLVPGGCTGFAWSRPPSRRGGQRSSECA
jgi:hypothetical protein